MERAVLVVGLGNPGPKYNLNRHNFGFMVLEELARSTPFAPSWQEKFKGQFTKITAGDVSYTLLKPLTFMNLSGHSVSRAVQYFGFSLEQIIVVHDEIDLPFEAMRIKNGGGTAGHKGITSIKNELGDGGFARVRMGVGRPVHGSVSDYVLSDFSRDEQAALPDLLTRGSQAVQAIAREGITPAMNTFNRTS